jgi:hypothetical protein
MTGFSDQWLALREGADHAARDASLRSIVAASLAGRAEAEIVDLACGTGSNLRALAASLPGRQRWRLVDVDPVLLAAARERLLAWADHVESLDPLVILKGERQIEVSFWRRDLASADFDALAPSVDLVTAAALFDLVSAQWIEGFCDELARRRLPLYAVLTYSGEEQWLPAHPADKAMLAAFHRHQQRDKGFGSATGPRGALELATTLQRRGYVTTVRPSPWRLGPPQAALIEALADGAAKAVGETGLVRAEAIESWRQARRSASSCLIGHIDLFAQPG